MSYTIMNIKASLNAVAISVIVAVTGCSSPPQTGDETSIPASQKQTADTDKHKVPAQIQLEDMTAPMEGVFHFENGFSGLLLELKNGQYRYWFYSDVSTENGPTYPISGSYTVEGTSIRLQSQETTLQKDWKFKQINGQTTLWRPNAEKLWLERRILDSYGILYFSSKKPEEVWGKLGR